jgi:hypothetical protein
MVQAARPKNDELLLLSSLSAQSKYSRGVNLLLFLFSLSSHSYPLLISLLPSFFPLSLHWTTTSYYWISPRVSSSTAGARASSPSCRPTGAPTATSWAAISSTVRRHGLRRAPSPLRLDPSFVHVGRSRPHRLDLPPRSVDGPYTPSLTQATGRMMATTTG